MNLLKKRGVAIAITAIVIVFMSLVGIRNAPANLPPVQTGQWVYDGADVLSSQQESDLKRINEELISDHGAVIAVATMPDVKGWDLMEFCADLGDTWGLNGDSFILVLDIGGDNYWLVQGYDLLDLFTDDMAGQYAWQFLENDFAAKNYGDGVMKLVDALHTWYDGTYALAGQLNIGNHDDPNVGFYDGQPMEYAGSGFGFGSILLLILFAVILIVVLDSMRYNNYRRRVIVTPGILYRPLIFGRPRRHRAPPPPGGNHRRPPTGGGSGGFGSGPRPGGTTHRPSSGSSFGGGRSSGSFSGGRTGSFGGGRSSGGFSGGRSGSFGGGRSSGGFSGGGSRGGGRR